MTPPPLQRKIFGGLVWRWYKRRKGGAEGRARAPLLEGQRRHLWVSAARSRGLALAGGTGPASVSGSKSSDTAAALYDGRPRGALALRSAIRDVLDRPATGCVPVDVPRAYPAVRPRDRAVPGPSRPLRRPTPIRDAVGRTPSSHPMLADRVYVGGGARRRRTADEERGRKARYRKAPVRLSRRRNR